MESLNKEQTSNINYILLRDSMYDQLNSSIFTKGITIVNFWNLYGRAVVKRTDGRFLYSDFKILIQKDKIEYFLGFEKLGEIIINEFILTNYKSKIDEIMTSIVQKIRANYSKGYYITSKEVITPNSKKEN